MQLVVFGSGLGTNLEALLRAQRELKTSTGQALFEVKALFTDRDCRFQEIAERERLPLIHHSYVKFCKDRGLEDMKDRSAMEAYDTKNVELLEQCAAENHFSIDLIFLIGYVRPLSTPVLKQYKHKILNIHPADLTLTDEKGRRKYVGTNAVFDALMNGETRTRSSVILVDKTVDDGPILISGPWLDYNEGEPVTFKRAASHHDKQKTHIDWKTCVRAVQLIAEGRLGTDEHDGVYFDHHPVSIGGYLLDPS